jgi:hypothetical protein
LGDNELLEINSADYPQDQVTEITPIHIQQALHALNDKHVVDLIQGSLTTTVRDHARFYPKWGHGKVTFPLFLAGRTSRDRCRRVYKCRQRSCCAEVVFRVERGKVHFESANHEHNHSIAFTSSRRANALTAKQRQDIITWTEAGLSIQKIRARVCPDVEAQAVYDTRRAYLKQKRENQAETLREQIAHWDDFSTCIVTDKDGMFTDCYFFHELLCVLTDVPFRETWIMDDTACTLMLGLPLVASVGVDQNNHDQILAFAFCYDRTAASFLRFLSWVRSRLPFVPQEPKVFVVDRHKGQFKAIREAFLKAVVLFCAEHLGANIKTAFSKNPDSVLGRFWRVVRGGLTVADWQEFLREELQMKHTAKQLKLLQWLLENVEFYAAEFADKLTFEDVSSRVEGLFAIIKKATEHKLCTLLDLAEIVRRIARGWFLELSRSIEEPLGPFCSPDVLSEGDQMRLGSRARKLFGKEAVKFSGRRLPFPASDRTRDGSCCPELRKWTVPCVHKIALSRTNPRITLMDFPERWRLPLADHDTERFEVPFVHQEGLRDIEEEYLQAEWDRDFGLALIAPIVDAAPTDQAARELLIEVRQRWDHAAGLPSSVADDIHPVLSDPVHPAHRGASFVHPAWNSPVLPGFLWNIAPRRRRLL